MSDSSPVFGKRGPRAVKSEQPAKSRAPDLSPAHRELAVLARKALRERDDIEADVQPSREKSGGGGVDEDMRAFIGGNWHAYRGLWARMKDSPGLSMSRCYPAALFTSVWLLYRKQYALGFVILAAQAALTKLEPAGSGLFDLLLAGFLSQFGKSIVLLKGVAKIKQIRMSGLPPEAASIRLLGAGGTNLVLAICGFAFMTGLLVSSVGGAFRLEGVATIDLKGLQSLFPDR